jgi:hypothetical protein
MFWNEDNIRYYIPEMLTPLYVFFTPRDGVDEEHTKYYLWILLKWDPTHSDRVSISGIH